MQAQEVNEGSVLGFLGSQVTDTHLDNERSHWPREPEGGSTQPAARRSNGIPCRAASSAQATEPPGDVTSACQMAELDGDLPLTHPLWAAGSCD